MHRGSGRLSAIGVWLAAVLAMAATAQRVCSSDAVTSASSQCVACHTRLKPLIRLCWEVEKVKPAAKASAENAGEG